MLNFFYDGPNDLQLYKIPSFIYEIEPINFKHISTIDGETGYLVYNYDWIKEMWELYFGIDQFFNLSNDNSLFNRLSQKSIEQLQKGNLKLIVDYSTEGANNLIDIFINPILSNCQELNIDPVNICIIHGNVYNQYNQLYQPGLKIIKYSWFEDFGRPLKNKEQWFIEEDMYEEKVILNKLDQKRTHKFLMFNRMPREHRSLIVLFLLKKKYLKYGFVSFPNQGFLPWPNPKKRENTTKTTLINAIKHFGMGGFESEINQIINMPLMKLDVDDFIMSNPTHKNPSSLYLNSYFSIVTESLITKETLFFTEKTFKAIKGMHPFIFVGNPGSLEYLRHKGYETFSPYINEDYDKEENETKRMKMILNEIDKLCSMSLEELHKFYQILKPRILHNYNWYMYERPADIEYVIKKLKWYLKYDKIV